MNAKINQGIRVIRLHGAILRKDAERLEAEFSSPDLYHMQSIILDLSDVNYICSSALGVFVTFKRKLKHKDIDLKLIVTDEDIRQVFEITMLDKVFEIFRSSDEAIAKS